MPSEEKILKNKGLTFDDVLLVPNYAKGKRQDIDLTTQLTDRLSLSLPFLTAPMDTVTESAMAIACGKIGALGVIHRNMTVAAQAEEVKKVKNHGYVTSAAIGVGADTEERLAALVHAGLDVVVIDSAHGFSLAITTLVAQTTKRYPGLVCIAGNVATAAGAKALIDAGAHILRVGMGPGSICTTRVIAGVGVPQLTAIFETVQVAKTYGVPVIADGGIRTSGDIVKAIAAGASAVMCGSLFAGCKEAPGETMMRDRKRYKVYRGMGSVAAMKEGSAARYGQDYHKGQKRKLVAEGVEGFVPSSGTLQEKIEELSGGLRSGMYYVGAQTIEALQRESRFLRITPASVIENYPHDILLSL